MSKSPWMLFRSQHRRLELYPNGPSSRFVQRNNINLAGISLGFLGFVGVGVLFVYFCFGGLGGFLFDFCLYLFCFAFFM